MPGYPFSSKEGSHIEIVQNTANSHYDSVIPISKSAFLDVPALKGDISDTIIWIPLYEIMVIHHLNI